MKPDEMLDALISLPRLFGPKVSSDGKWVAWNWLGIGPGIDVYLASTGGSAAPIQLTNTDQNTFLVSWAPDNQSVIVEQDKDGDERYRLFRVFLNEPGLMQPLTEENPNYFLRGGDLHPNERWLVYAANLDPDSGEEIEQTLLYRHDLQSGDRKVLARPQKGAYYVPHLNTTGTHILYERKDKHPGGRQVWLVDIEGNEDRQIFSAGDDKKAYATWLPDGKRVLILAETDTHRKLGLWSMETGEVKWLIDDPQRNLDNVHAPHGTHLVIVGETQNALEKASLLDVETGEETRLPDIPGNLWPLAPVGNGEWAGLVYSSKQPQDVMRFRPEELSVDTMTSLSQVWERTELTPDDLAQAEDYHWQSMDGLEIQGWFYRTKSEPKGTVVFVHGGPTGHSSDAINAQIQYFVAQGFNVLDPNYRGSTGFTLEFMESIKEDGWGGREQDDIRAGIEALIEAGLAQKGRVGITGTSYGGYSSWCAITRFPVEVLKASAPVCGMTDLVVDYHTTRPDLRPYSEEMLGGRPDEVPEKYHDRSPVNFVENIKGHLLIVQGMQDPNVTPENVSEVRQALNKAGIEHQLLAFEDEGHGIIRPKNRKVLYRRLAEFFEGAFDEEYEG